MSSASDSVVLLGHRKNRRSIVALLTCDCRHSVNFLYIVTSSYPELQSFFTRTSRSQSQKFAVGLGKFLKKMGAALFQGYPSKWSILPFSLFLAILFVPLLIAKTKTDSIASYAKYVQIPGAKPVGPEACAGCHDVVVKSFGHGFHAQQGVECEQCHGAGSLHVDGGGDVSKIVAFGSRTPEQANGVCLSCHAREERTRHWISGSHAANHVRCIDCHQIHQTALRAAKGERISFDQATRGTLTAAAVSPETNVILRPMWETNDACLRCHPTQAAQLSMPYHHPLREGKMSCVDCHDPHGGPDGRNLKTSVANARQLCLSCHAQYRGPYAYQHPPVTENCLLCHVAHGSANTNLLSVSEPALCLQCHAGHHNGAGTPLPDRCTNCHVSIHGTDVPTPSGGSRFVDKGPSERDLRTGTAAPAAAKAHVHLTTAVGATPQLVASHAPTLATAGVGGLYAMMSSGTAMAPFGTAAMGQGGASAGSEIEAGSSSAYSFTPGQYRFVDGSGYLGRVGEYDSLEQSAGADFSQAYVSTNNHLTAVSRANVLSGKDYSAGAQLTAGDWLEVGFFIRSFVQQQDHYNFYAFPVLDVPPGSTTSPDTSVDLIPGQSVFGVTRRLGNAYGRFKVPKLPVHLFVKGDWQARAGNTQLAYLDENTGVDASTCGQECHFSSQFQSANYTTRNISGGAQVDLGQFQATYEHAFSSFNDRLEFPTGAFGGFFPEVEGVSAVNPAVPPAGCVGCSSGPAPPDVLSGNYFLNPVSPSQASSDRVSVNWTATPSLSFNGNVSYTRMRNMYTHYPQNTFNTDNTLNWRPIDRLRLTVDYHQQNLVNNFTPYYSLYGNLSYHQHEVGVRGDYELPLNFDLEGYYTRAGISRANAFLWPQVYSIDNTDLLTVVPSSTSNTTGLALRYHDRNYWSVRGGYEWTGTNNPGYLIIPGSNNRAFADVTVTPAKWLSLSNDFSAIVQNAFPAIPLMRSDGTGLEGDFQRRNRFYYETLSTNFHFVPDWNLGLGYSYQQNNLTTYMSFQNDSGAGYVINEPAVPIKQITQAYWAETSYTFAKRFGVSLRASYNSSRSGMRPDVNPNDAAQLGNASLISQGAFDPDGLFPTAMNNLQFSATQISEVIVPQWIGQGKAYYMFPRKFEGGMVFYYGSYRDYWNPNVNGVLRTFTLYVGKSW
jgi:predicted CXXCH cytochrome family protein